jgi:hypothetical protein
MPRRSFPSFQRRLSRKAHGCEPPFSKRYGEAASSTTKGRGAGTQALYPGLCIHLGASVHLKRGNTAIVVMIIVIIVVLAGMYYLTARNLDHGGPAVLHAIIIALEDGYSFDLKEDFNLSDESILNFTNDTMCLKLTLDGNQSLYYPNHVSTYYSSIKLSCGTGYNYLHISWPEVNKSHTLSIQLLINSTDPEILNLNLFGNNNTLNCDVYIDEEWDINIIMEEGFEEHLFVNYGGYAKIMLINPPDGEGVIKFETLISVP